MQGRGRIYLILYSSTIENFIKKISYGSYWRFSNIYEGCRRRVIRELYKEWRGEFYTVEGEINLRFI
jgi:hypothetical protein